MVFIKKTKAILVQVDFSCVRGTLDFNEFESLAISAGCAISGIVSAKKRKPDAGLFLGQGKAEEVRCEIQATSSELVIFNHALSPIQQRNLEKLLECRVLDRSGLILDIFAQRARSHEGKLQVELAQLTYLSTRLIRGWTHLERQRGGIGLRGPGEKQLETDRRLINQRVSLLKKRLHKVEKQRSLHQRNRQKNGVFSVALVGYTNAGKTSLFNALTDAKRYAADRLFATLDPAVRKLNFYPFLSDLSDRETGMAVKLSSTVISDTVGFVSNLPHTLVAAFRATLEEVVQADLICHVVNASSDNRDEQISAVEKVLIEIGVDDIPQVIVFNKIDLTEIEPAISRDGYGRLSKVFLSAKTGAGLEFFVQAVSEQLKNHFSRERASVVVDY